MSETPDTQLVHADELDLEMIAPSPRRLKLPVGQPRTTRTFTIRGRLDVDRMVAYLQLEKQINEALAGDEETTLIEALDAANRVIRDLLLDLNAPEDVPEKLGLDEQQILVLLAWISGDISVADAIAHALTGGISGTKTAEELGADTDADAGADRADAAAPFSSSTSS